MCFQNDCMVEKTISTNAISIEFMNTLNNYFPFKVMQYFPLFTSYNQSFDSKFNSWKWHKWKCQRPGIVSFNEISLWNEIRKFSQYYAKHEYIRDRFISDKCKAGLRFWERTAGGNFYRKVLFLRFILFVNRSKCYYINGKLEANINGANMLFEESNVGKTNSVLKYK